MTKTVYEISEELRIPVSKLKKLHSLGHLVKVTFPDREPLEKIIFTFKKRGALTVAQFRELILEPAKLASLGEWSGPIKRRIKALGDVKGEALPLDKFPHVLIDNAANKDAEALAKFSEWIASIIPAEGCSYHYVAIRAVLNVSDAQFPVVYSGLSKAIRNARGHENLAGMSDIVDRATIFYRRQEFDL